MDLIRSLKTKGLGVIFISHNLADMFAVSDRIVVLRRGVVAGERQVGHVDPEEIVRLMVGQ
jgi:simple sugar transport system ATP-binding protein